MNVDRDIRYEVIARLCPNTTGNILLVIALLSNIIIFNFLMLLPITIKLLLLLLFFAYCQTAAELGTVFLLNLPVIICNHHSLFHLHHYYNYNC